MITEMSFMHFTVFEELNIKFSPGINVLIGTNGTGKTHLMKVAYAACDITKTHIGFAEKIVRVFRPKGQAIGRLVKRQQGSAICTVSVYRGEQKLSLSFSNHVKLPQSPKVKLQGAQWWLSHPIQSVFIPVKEMLSNGPGFLSLYDQREIHFSEIYADILNRAYTPKLKGPIDYDRKVLLDDLQKIMYGRVEIDGDEFFLKNKQGNLEFMLLAEGMRKLGLLWLLIQNGTLLNGTVLFWDEPETNLNPGLYGPVIDILLKLQRMGVQIFLATHDYVILKELDLRSGTTDKIAFHALYKDRETGDIQCATTSDYLQIAPNAIADTFSDLYNREIARSIGMA